MLFGGQQVGGWANDTWESGETGWVNRQDIGPGPFPAMVYAGSRTVLFAVNQTWEWSGQLWTQRQNMGPQGRTLHAMAYDLARERVVLFGGTSSANIQLGDTWELTIISAPS